MFIARGPGYQTQAPLGAKCYAPIGAKYREEDEDCYKHSVPDGTTTILAYHHVIPAFTAEAPQACSVYPRH